MSVELTMLAWTLVLALVYVFAAAGASTRQYGLKWNAGPRDETLAPPDKMTGRLRRAQANLYETLPLFIGAVLALHALGREGAVSAIGAQLYFWGRVVYLPLYGMGVPMVRSLVWGVSFLGLVLILLSLLGVV